MKLLKLKKIWILLLLILVGGFFYYQKGKETQPEYDFITAEKDKLVQKVSVTGKVKPVDNTNLTFEQNGKIQTVSVEIGDSVKAGDELVRLTNEELLAKKTETIANLNREQALLKEVKRGKRTGELNIEANRNSSSETVLENAQNSLKVAIEEARTEARYIIQNTIQGLTDNPSYKNSKLVFQTTYSSKLNDLNNQKFYLQKMMQDWDRVFVKANNATYQSNLALENLEQLKIFIDDLVFITPTLDSRLNSVQTKLTSWKTASNTTQVSINQAISKITQAQNTLLSAQKSLSVSNEEFSFAQSGSSEEQIAIQEASVLASQSRVQQIQAQINKTILYAPFDGIVTKVNAKKGEIISLASGKEIMISMIGNQLEIEVNVPEIDISKIKIGDAVEIKFDAFSEHSFESRVKFIEPAETEVQGVVYYQIKVELDLKTIEMNIRSGMSVEVDIVTEEKDSVIKIPQRMVIRKDGNKIVRILKPHNDSYDEIEVVIKTGITDDTGNIEILSGLEVGDLLSRGAKEK